MYVFFAYPEPLILVANRLKTHGADPFHHAHCIGIIGPSREPRMVKNIHAARL